MDNQDYKTTELEYEEIIDDYEKESIDQEKKKKQLKRKVRIRNVVIFILILIILLLLLRSCGVDNSLINLIPNLETNNFVDNTPSDGEIPRIDIPVVTDVILSAEKPYMHFFNPETNKDRYYLKYEIYDENAQRIYRSELVEAGTRFSVDVYDLFGGEQGDHMCTVNVRTFKVGSLIEVNGTNNDVTITIK